jgi:fucose 4-O-acetylase-like acetyltransferase
MSSPGTVTSQAQRVHDATPASRNRVVDFLRAAAITVVVLGHWTMAAVYVDGDELIDPHGMLNDHTYLHPITWVFQVMPIFFLVGGYSNGLSWRSARRKNQPYAGWLRARLRRLAVPVIPLLVFWVVAASVLLAAGVPAATLRTASQIALVPTWFLAAYVLVVAVAPLCLRLWEKYGWWSIVGGIALASAVDAASILLHNPYVGFPNYLLVWAAFHQVGYAWLDGRLDGTGRRIALACVGFAGLALLVGAGPYPVSMIGIDGAEINNSYPTRITMAFLGFAQSGLVLLAERRLNAWMQRPRAWFATVVINQRIMTWYLWHLTAMVVFVAVLLPVGGPGLHIAPGTGLWWVTRPLWWAVLIVVTFGFVLALGKVENPRPDDRPSPAVWRPVLATAAVCAGLAVMANSGLVSERGVTWIWPLLPVVGLLGLGMVRVGRAPAKS